MNPHLLIDSHILVWLLYEPERFKPETLELIKTAEQVSVSSVSLWELAIKHNKGKLAYSTKALIAGVEALSLQLITLEPAHIMELKNVRLPHNDPFDAMLIAQCKAEDCIFVTADAAVLSSDVHTHDVR